MINFFKLLNKIKIFLLEIKDESKNITYPNYINSFYFSILVILLTLSISFLIWILDNILIYLFSFIIKFK